MGSTRRMSGWYDPGDVAFGGAARESGGAEGVDGAESVERASCASGARECARRGRTARRDVGHGLYGGAGKRPLSTL